MANKPLDISHYVAHYFHCDFGYFFLNSVFKLKNIVCGLIQTLFFKYPKKLTNQVLPISG